MKKIISRERIRYWFDCIMSKGPVAMSVLLFAITAVIVGLIGIAAFFVGDGGGIIYQVWMSLMHTLDAGTLAGNGTENIPYLILMSAATLVGLFLTSILIGIIATGVENKLNDLRKGTSIVQEHGHTTIIGFDINVFDLLRELIEANANKKKACIVILGEQPKDEMEDAISAHIPDTGTTRIICRSGSLHAEYALERCAVEASQSVIVNIHDDAEAIKTLLALSSYLRGKELANPDFHIVASIQEKQNVEVANIASSGLAQIIYVKDAISRIIANTCRQHGLSQVLSEMFNFGGNEFYFEQVPEMEGKTFRETLFCFPNAVVVGLYSAGQVQLNPPMSTVITQDDMLILLEEDDGAYNICTAKDISDKQIRSSGAAVHQSNNHLVVLGSNDKLPIILSEYNHYVSPNTKVVIVDDDFNETSLPAYENLNISVCTKPVTQELLCELLEKDVKNILILNDDSQEPEVSDSQTLLRLILLRDIADKAQRRISITTEMRSADNQKLASQARVDDFVIGNNFTSLLMAQISENHRISPLIADLLDESGSEFYMKPAANYVPIGEPVNSYILTESAARKGEIYVGYRLMGAAKRDVIVNPLKDDTIVFGQEDQLVVISEN